MKKNDFSRVIGSGCFAVTVILSASCPSAYAGFSYTPSQKTAPVSGDIVSAPEEKTVVVSGEMLLPPPGPEMSVPPLPVPVASPSDVPPLPIKGGVLPQISKNKFSGEKIEGFGTGIPLVIALRQIVPPRYAFVFGQKLDLGKKIDWQGGRPWDEVLNGLGEQYGFTVDVTGNTVTVGPVSEQAEPVKKQPKAEDVTFIPVVPSAMPEPLNVLPSPPPGENAPTSLISDAAKTTEEITSGEASSLPPVVKKENQEVLPVLEKKIIVAEKEKPVVTYNTVKDEGSIVPPTPLSSSEVLPPPAENIAPIKASAEVAAAVPTETKQPETEPFLIENQESVWTAKKNDTLRSTLQAWADTQRISLVWNSEYDYPIQSDVSEVGKFQDAVRHLLDGFSSADPKPYGKMYMNKPAGVPVLVIESNRIEKQ